MGCDNWNNFLKDLLRGIGHKISLLEDYYRFSCVSKLWKSATEAAEKPWWPTTTPMLLLAKEVAPGSNDNNFPKDLLRAPISLRKVTTMGYDNWNNLPKDLLIEIVLRLRFLDDYYSFSAVCESWNSAAAATEKPWWLPTRTPMLLLAEEVAPGSIIYDTEYDLNQDYGDTDDEQDVADFYANYDSSVDVYANYDYSKNSVGTRRGLYSLSSKKTYNIELPEAAAKLILGTSKGWLLTLGRDLQINLLHPLLRLQFSLPPMLTFPGQPDPCYDEVFTAADVSEELIQRVAMSSNLLNKNTDVSFFHHHATSSPIVMAIYGASKNNIGFARLGDKVWTDVNVPSLCPFHDIVYHRGNFYAVDGHGGVYVCCIDDGEAGGGPRVTKIASLKKTDDSDNIYLVEPLTGCGLLLVVRYTKNKYFRESSGFTAKYRTTDFAVLRLDPNYDDSLKISSGTFTKVNNLGNEAIFVGRASSLSVSSSEIIKPNSIYFTDDSDHYLRQGGGHDMGIFDMERRTIEPHFQGKSLHCISPPLWYI